MKPETIKELLDNGMTSSQLVEALTKDQKIRENKLHYEQQIDYKTNRHNEEIKILQEEIGELRKICPHYETTYIPDASGNNDSYHICTACGKESKRLPI